MKTQIDPMDVKITLLAVCISSIAFGVILFRFLETLRYYTNYYKNRAKSPDSLPVDDSKTCQNKPHSWNKTKLALKDLEFGSYLVCIDCGKISGSEFMLNASGLEAMKEQVVKRDRKNTINARFKEIVDADFDMWFKTFGMNFGKDEAGNRKLLKNFFDHTLDSIDSAATISAEEVDRKS